jgi:transposase-like protein
MSMFSYEDRIKAVQHYIDTGKRSAYTRQVLGYPSKSALKYWYKEFMQTGELHRIYERAPYYSEDEKQIAVDHYLNHGQHLSWTIRYLGYPSREVLMAWIDELAPNARKTRVKHHNMINFSLEQKTDAVTDLCTREGPAQEVAHKHRVSRLTLYKWKKQLLGEECRVNMKRDPKASLAEEKAALLEELAELQKMVYRQQMELDILKKAAELLKKDPGIDLQMLKNREKYELIDALKTCYPLSVLREFMQMSKSSYYYQQSAYLNEDKYLMLRQIVKDVYGEKTASIQLVFWRDQSGC